MLMDIYKTGDISPRISNDVLDVLIKTNTINSSPQKVFAYCYLGLIAYFDINNKYTFRNIKVQDIKRYLGYSEMNKKVDYIIKKNGSLEQLGLIIDKNNPYEGAKNHVKVPLILDEMKECHTFNLSLFFKCMNDNKLGTIGFFIANYIKEFETTYTYGTRGSVNYLSNILNIPTSTVSNYLEELAELNLINKNSVRNHDTLTEMSLHFRSKLNVWKNDSLQIHDDKCFVTGKKNNLVVHHIVPFNQIRDYVLNELKLENKPITDFTNEEFKLIESRIVDYHKLSIGVPLNETIHKQFHFQYGNYATLENLLEFKYQYLRG
jgi:hypothetical protein